MKKETVKEFTEATNKLLDEKFSEYSAALVMLNHPDGYASGIKGKGSMIAYIISCEMVKNHNFYLTIKNAIAAYEETMSELGANSEPSKQGKP
jgi:hypothetical protein